MTLRERLEAIQELETLGRDAVPWEFARAFNNEVSINGCGVSFHNDGDSLSLPELQALTAWMVEQFGLPPKKAGRK